MTVVLDVLSWIFGSIGILLGIALLVILAVLFVKIKLILIYKEESGGVWLKILFVKLRLYPEKDKKSKKKTEPSETPQQKQTNRETSAVKTVEETPPQPEQKTEATPKPVTKDKQTSPPPKKKKKLDWKEITKEFTLDTYLDLLRAIITEFIAKIHLDKLNLNISVGAEDSAQVALRYGAINAAVYPILGALSASGNLKKCKVQISPNFLSEKTEATGTAIFSLRLFRCLGVLPAIFALLKKN